MFVEYTTVGQEAEYRWEPEAPEDLEAQEAQEAQEGEAADEF